VVGNKASIKKLEAIIQKCEKAEKPIAESDFGNLWLGAVIKALGYNPEKFECRGQITEYYIKNDVLVIHQETAWCEQKGFRQAIEKRYPSLCVFFIDEEPGCDVYATNDLDGKYFPYKYYLDTSEGSEEFKTIDDAAKYVAGVVCHSVRPTIEYVKKACEEYEEKLQEQDEDGFFAFHVYQYSK